MRVRVSVMVMVRVRVTLEGYGWRVRLKGVTSSPRGAEISPSGS